MAQVTTQATAEQIRKPRLGDRPKRGVKDITLKIKNKDVKFNPHHQKQLLIELLEFKQGEAKLDDLVELIESNEDYWKRLNTVQSPYNCVVYHAKQLSDCGYLIMETKTATGTVETSKKTPDPKIEVVNYMRNKALGLSNAVSEDDDSEKLEVRTEIDKKPDVKPIEHKQGEKSKA
jgi:hypothetical protein